MVRVCIFAILAIMLAVSFSTAWHFAATSWSADIANIVGVQLWAVGREVIRVRGVAVFAVMKLVGFFTPNHTAHAKKVFIK